MAERVLPTMNGPDTAPFWAAAAQQRLVVRFCESCDQPVHLPKAICPRCHGPAEHWREVTGRGRLHSWTVVEHQVHPAHPTPYAVVIVALEEYPDVRLLACIPGRPDLKAEQSMEVWFEQVSDVTLPQWRPTDRNGAGEDDRGRTSVDNDKLEDE